MTERPPAVFAMTELLNKPDTVATVFEGVKRAKIVMCIIDPDTGDTLLPLSQIMVRVSQGEFAVLRATTASDCSDATPAEREAITDMKKATWVTAQIESGLMAVIRQAKASLRDYFMPMTDDESRKA